jgi:hypothetical protein
VSATFSKVEIKTTDLGHRAYMLEGQGGNITVAAYVAHAQEIGDA